MDFYTLLGSTLVYFYICLCSEITLFFYSSIIVSYNSSLVPYFIILFLRFIWSSFCLYFFDVFCILIPFSIVQSLFHELIIPLPVLFFLPRSYLSFVEFDFFPRAILVFHVPSFSIFILSGR